MMELKQHENILSRAACSGVRLDLCVLCDFHSVPCCLKTKLAWQHVVRVRVRCVSKLHWRVMEEEGL